MQFAVCFDLFDVFYKNRKRQKRPTNPLNFSKKKTICHFLEMSISVKKKSVFVVSGFGAWSDEEVTCQSSRNKSLPTRNPEIPKLLPLPCICHTFGLLHSVYNHIGRSLDYTRACYPHCPHVNSRRFHIQILQDSNNLQHIYHTCHP